MNAPVTMAHLCGPLGQALAVVADVTWLYEDKQRRQPTANEVNFFFSQGLEVRPVDPSKDGEPTEENLPSLLELETHRFQVLRGLLIGMDGEVDDQLRVRNMRRANRLLSDERISQFVERRFIRPVNSQEWDLERARRLARSEGLSAVQRLYEIVAAPTLIRLEDEIAAWGAQQGYSSIEQTAETRKAYANGLIAFLARAIYDLPPNEVLSKVFFAKSADWDKRLAAHLARTLVVKESTTQQRISDISEEDEKTQAASPELIEDVRARIIELLDQYDAGKRQRARDRRQIDGAASLKKAVKQVEWIERRFRAGKADAAWHDVIGLAEWQIIESGPENFAKSLTNIATRLSDQAPIAFALFDLAVACAHEDVTIHTARAETLRALGRLEEALAAYDRTVEDFPQDAVARNGRAGTLRALGRLEEALAAYDRAVEDFPQDAFARTGRAETLRALGRLEEALAAYDRTVEDFPQDAVARTGRAETLRALGRLEEALAAYDRTVEDFPQDAVARNGRAETLRALGRLEEALAAYDRTVEDFPQDAFARNGRAETLRALGRLEEALAAYDSTVEDFPQDAVARNGRAGTLRALGRLEEALAAYDRAVEDFPQDAFARTGRAETLRALGRLEEALAAYDRTVEDFPQDAVARTGRAETLRALGRLEEALAAYDRTVEDFPQNAVARTGRAETLRALGRLEEALAAYDSTVEDFPQDAVARNGRAVVLIDLGRFDAARNELQLVADEAITATDWVAMHILSMIELQSGATEKLATNLQRYANICPFIEQRRYFETSLAVVRLSLRQIKEARRSIVDLSRRIDFDRDERAALKLMQAHAEAAEGNLAAAREIIASASSIVSYEEFRLRQLRRQIESRFGIGDRPAPSKPEDVAAEDRKLARLEIGFFVDRVRAQAQPKAA